MCWIVEIWNFAIFAGDIFWKQHPAAHAQNPYKFTFFELLIEVLFYLIVIVIEVLYVCRDI